MRAVDAPAGKKVACLIAIVCSLGRGIATAQAETRVTVMTRSAEKIEGALRSITPEEVVLDIAGQPLRLPIARIKYISFVGDLEATLLPKEAPAPKAIDKALGALKDLRAATEVGILREQYSQKMLDTLPRVNEFAKAKEPDWADVRAAMGMAARLYEQALDLDSWKNAGELWSHAANYVDYAVALASDPTEERHTEQQSEQTIQLGQPIKGRLGFGDVVMPRELDNSSKGGFNDVYKFELPTQTSLSISMTGGGTCAPHLVIADAHGKKIEGDQGGYRFASKINRKLMPGVYSIWAGAPLGEVCSYTLTVRNKGTE